MLHTIQNNLTKEGEEMKVKIMNEYYKSKEKNKENQINKLEDY